MEVQKFTDHSYADTLTDSESLEEYNRIKEELDLKCGNQKGKGSPVPYRYMDRNLRNHLKVLVPQSTNLDEYTGMIPLEVMKMIENSHYEKHFDWMEVWDNREDKDPILVGRLYREEEDREKGFDFSADHYLIARWGDEAKDLSVLMQEAEEIVRQKIEKEAKRVKASIDNAIQHPDSYVDKVLEDAGGMFSHNDVAQILVKD